MKQNIFLSEEKLLKTPTKKHKKCQNKPRLSWRGKRRSGLSWRHRSWVQRRRTPPSNLGTSDWTRPWWAKCRWRAASCSTTRRSRICGSYFVEFNPFFIFTCLIFDSDLFNSLKNILICPFLNPVGIAYLRK